MYFQRKCVNGEKTPEKRQNAVRRAFSFLSSRERSKNANMATHGGTGHSLLFFIPETFEPEQLFSAFFGTRRELSLKFCMPPVVTFDTFPLENGHGVLAY